MNEPVAVLALALVISVVVAVYWRVIVAVLAVAAIATFIAGLLTVVDAIHRLQ
jgi:hypothetical protein